MENTSNRVRSNATRVAAKIQSSKEPTPQQQASLLVEFNVGDPGLPIRLSLEVPTECHPSLDEALRRAVENYELSALLASIVSNSLLPSGPESFKRPTKQG